MLRRMMTVLHGGAQVVRSTQLTAAPRQGAAPRTGGRARYLRYAVLGCLMVASLGTMSCAVLNPEPSKAYETVRPTTPPIRTMTNFSESLRCLDELTLRYGLGPQGVGKVYVTSQGIVDKTGKVGPTLPNVDHRELIISTISKMTARSESFVFVNYNPRDPEELYKHLVLIAGEKGKEFILPSYEIVAAVTELNENVRASSLGISLAFGEGDLGFSKDQLVTVLAVDFNVNHAITRQVLSGVTATNMIAIARRGVAGDAGARIKKVGVAFNLSLDNNEGLGAALRTVTELSLIEVLGKLAKVPYWQCLYIDQAHPEVLAMTEDWFNSMQETERVTLVQRLLTQQGYYRDSVGGTMNPATRDAIARYQAASGQAASGRIDLALYRQLIGREVRPQDKATYTTAAPTTPAVPTPAVSPLQLTLTTARGPEPVYNVNEQLSLAVEVSRDAYLYCYYRDGHQRISRVYPTRFQQNAYVRARQVVTIPAEQHFALVLDTPNITESVLCLASPEDLEVWLPHQLRSDLESLAFASLDDVATALRQNNPPELAEARVNVRVR